MLGLIFIFVIMLMVFALDMRHAQRQMTDTTTELTEANLARLDLLRDVAKILEGKLPVTIDEANGTLQLGGDILFPSRLGRDLIPRRCRSCGSSARRSIGCCPAMRSPPKRGRRRPAAVRHQGRLDAVYIEGHTDTTPIHTSRFQNNWDLSAARASATFSRLVETFPASAR